MNQIRVLQMLSVLLVYQTRAQTVFHVRLSTRAILTT